MDPELHKLVEQQLQKTAEPFHATCQAIAHWHQQQAIVNTTSHWDQQP